MPQSPLDWANAARSAPATSPRSGYRRVRTRCDEGSTYISESRSPCSEGSAYTTALDCATCWAAMRFDARDTSRISIYPLHRQDRAESFQSWVDSFSGGSTHSVIFLNWTERESRPTKLQQIPRLLEHQPLFFPLPPVKDLRCPLTCISHPSSSFSPSAFPHWESANPSHVQTAEGAFVATQACSQAVCLR